MFFPNLIKTQYSVSPLLENQSSAVEYNSHVIYGVYAPLKSIRYLIRQYNIHLRKAFTLDPKRQPTFPSRFIKFRKSPFCSTEACFSNSLLLTIFPKHLNTRNLSLLFYFLTFFISHLLHD